MFLDLRCRRNSEEKNALIKRLRPSPDEGLTVLTRSKEAYINVMKTFCPNFTKPPEDALFFRGAGKQSGCVDAYGHFQLCMILQHPVIVYDIKNSSLKNAMNNFFP